MLRLCLPSGDAIGGGTASFYRNLRAYLETAGIPFTDRLDDAYDTLFVNSWVISYGAVLRARRRDPTVKVLHRIDGSATDYGREAIADFRQAFVNLLADVTVFQSWYGKHATTTKYPIIGHDGPVIHNPVDVRRFRPEGERVSLPGTIKVCHVTHSTNPRKGAPALYALARANAGVDFVLIGRYDAPPPLANLHCLGYADWDTLPKILRSCDVFVMLAEHEACPNVVLEAMASGAPVLFRDSGGTAELVGGCGRAIEPATFPEALEWALDQRESLRQAARRRAVEEFSPGVVFPRYLDSLRSAPRRRLPGRREQVKVLRRCLPILFRFAWQRLRGTARKAS